MMTGRVLDDTATGTVAVGDLAPRRLGFGAMRISGARTADGVRDRDLARQLCRRAYERGITFFDTADIYGYGESEEIIAEALRPYPDDLVIATKAGFRPGKILPGHHTLPPLGTPEHIRTACETSLRRLQVDHLDVYQVHTPDPTVPFADTVGAFVELQQQGRVRHIGLCNVSVAQLELARSMCTVVSVQNRYNASDRTHEDVLRACEQAGIAFLPWQPLELRAGAAARAVADVACKTGATRQQAALAWLLRRAPVMLPIPGTSQLSHLDSNVDAAWATMTDDDYDAIDA
ncbi:MAG TPA: aldo/keto reductase, partial [Mycobacteriales bacterium]|nr:aldo/keto reductase [Mycobacteriales bacterium]